MRLFLYEFITGGGLWATSDEPSGSLLQEGAAMRDAIVQDALRLGAAVLTLRDARTAAPATGLDSACRGRANTIVVRSSEEHAAAFARLAREADWTLVIAPEFDDHLLRLSEQVLQIGGKLLSPAPAFIDVAADKNRTAAALLAANAPTPHGIALAPGERPPSDFPFPAVLKPHDGAGSMSVRRVNSALEAWSHIQSQPPRVWRLEALHVGLAASCAVLCGPSGNQPLAAFTQTLADDDSFTYSGGKLIVEPELQARAQRLALQAVEALPPTKGYVGVDVVLGAAGDGREDVIIEVNPRLTTSYVGLRAACEQNLLQAMLTVSSGERVDLRFGAAEVEFDATGVVRRLTRATPEQAVSAP